MITGETFSTRVSFAFRRMVCLGVSVACSLVYVSTTSAQYTEANSYLNPTSVVTLGTPGYSNALTIDTAAFQRFPPICKFLPGYRVTHGN